MGAPKGPERGVEGMDAPGKKYKIFISYTHWGDPQKDKISRYGRWIAHGSFLMKYLKARFMNGEAVYCRDYFEACEVERKLKNFKFSRPIRVRYGIPKKRPLTVFRDEAELVSEDLTASITEALHHSEYLLVVHSRHSKTKPWISKEITCFKETEGAGKRIIPWVIDGIPFCSLSAGKKDFTGNGEAAETKAFFEKKSVSGKKVSTGKKIPAGKNASSVLASHPDECIPQVMLELYPSSDHAPAAIDANVENEPATMDYRITRAVATVYGIKDVSELWKMVKRQKGTRRMIRLGIAIALISLGAVFYMKYGYTTTRYYANCVLRNHIPHGIAPIPASKIHRYWFYVQIQTRGGKVRHYELRSNTDAPDDRLPLEPTFSGSTVDLEYDDHTGKVSKLKEWDKNKMLKGVTIVYSDSLIGLNKENGEYATSCTTQGTQSNFSFYRIRRNERGEVVGIYLLPDNKSSVTPATPYAVLERNEEGLLASVDQSHMGRLFNGGSPVYRMRYDRRGVLVKVENYDAHRRPFVEKDGVHKTVLEGQGTPRLSIAYFDRAGQPCLGPAGVHKAERTIQCLKDRQLFLTRTFFYDTDHRLTESSLGVSRIDSYFNPDRSSMTLSYYDRDGKPICQEAGYHTLVYQASDTLRVTSYFDLQGSYTLHNKEGVAKEEIRYSGNRVEVTFYNERLEPCNNMEEKVGKIVYHTDQEGRVIYKGCFLPSRAPVWRDSYPPVVCVEYDERGNRASVRYEDGYGRPAVCDYGFTEERTTYDDCGCLVSAVFCDSLGKPVQTTAGYAKVEIAYPEGGRCIKYAYFTKDGAYRDPYAQAVEYVNEKNKVIREEKRDSVNRLIKIGGWAVLRQDYDSDRSFLVHKAYYDEQERPCGDANGIHQYFYEYDRHGNKILTRYRDTAGLPVVYEGCSLLKSRFNVKKQMIEVEAIDELTSKSERTIFSYSEDNRYTKSCHYHNDTLVDIIETYQEPSKRTLWMIRKDAHGNLTREQGQPAYTKVVRSPDNSIKEISYRDVRHQLMIPAGGLYAQLIEKEPFQYCFYNADSLLTSVEYGSLSEDLKMIRPWGKEGVVKKRVAYQGNVEIVSFYNTADTICPTQGGYAYLKRTKNQNGDVIRVEYLDTSARLCNARHPEGTYAICDFQYDDNQVPLYASYRDADGKLTEIEGGYSSEEWERVADPTSDERYLRIRENKLGYVTEAAFVVNPTGNCLYSADPFSGVAERIITYDSLYRPVGVHIYDEHKNLCNAPNYAILHIQYAGKSMMPSTIEYYSLKDYVGTEELVFKQTFERKGRKLSMYLSDPADHPLLSVMNDYSIPSDTSLAFTKIEMIQLAEACDFSCSIYDDFLRKHVRQTVRFHANDIISYGINPAGDTLLLPSVPYHLEAIGVNVFTRDTAEMD